MIDSLEAVKRAGRLKDQDVQREAKALWPGDPLGTDDRQIRRGDILRISCDPSIRVEPRKTRTCVVVSNDVANRFGQAITVVPTQRYTAERVQRAYMVDLRKPASNLQEARVANASMLMTYDQKRVVSRAGRISAEGERALDQALTLHLGLSSP